MKIEAGQIYQHFKGNKYKVKALAKMEADLKEMVVYYDIFEQDKLWIRPKKNFLEEVVVNGQKVKRFQLIK